MYKLLLVLFVLLSTHGKSVCAQNTDSLRYYELEPFVLVEKADNVQYTINNYISTKGRLFNKSGYLPLRMVEPSIKNFGTEIKKNDQHNALYVKSINYSLSSHDSLGFNDAIYYLLIKRADNSIEKVALVVKDQQMSAVENKHIEYLCIATVNFVPLAITFNKKDQVFIMRENTKDVYNTQMYIMTMMMHTSKKHRSYYYKDGKLIPIKIESFGKQSDVVWDVRIKYREYQQK